MPTPTLNRRIRFVLLGGMVLSLSLMAVGLALYALNPGASKDVALGPIEAIRALMNGDPLGLVDLGIMLLIATPLARLIVALWQFARGREWKMVVVALLVLSVVAVAVLLGGR